MRRWKHFDGKQRMQRPEIVTSPTILSLFTLYDLLSKIKKEKKKRKGMMGVLIDTNILR